MVLMLAIMLLAAAVFVGHGALVRLLTIPEPVFLGGDGFGGSV
jgi:hypothetical protein